MSVPAKQNEVRRQRGPLRVMFVITSLEVGGAETLLINLIRHLTPHRMGAQIACLKKPGELGQQVTREICIHDRLIHHKWDVGVVRRLKRLLKQEQIDAVVTVGAGDKMFWGRLAARSAGVPVILAALHSTGWPDGVGRLNRSLTPLTDGFIAVAESHRRFLIDRQGFPSNKVYTIPNGIDTNRFAFDPTSRRLWREQIGIPLDSPVCGIVAALRPEKNHSLFLDVAAQVHHQLPTAHFVIVGDGPERSRLEALSRQSECNEQVHFLGNSDDVCGLLSMMDVFSLTSLNEASPVSILEAMSCGVPIVAPQVGLIAESVVHDTTGLLVPVGDRERFVQGWLRVLRDATLRRRFGDRARHHVLQHGSLNAMTEGYMDLIENIYFRKSRAALPDTFQPDGITGSNGRHGCTNRMLH